MGLKPFTKGDEVEFEVSQGPKGLAGDKRDRSELRKKPLQLTEKKPRVKPGVFFFNEMPPLEEEHK